MTNTQTTIYKREISFLDADRKKATIEVEITTRNGYPEFTASGEYCGSLGQCLDSVKPATDEQKELVALWQQWHLNGMNAGTDRQAAVTKGLNYDESLRRLITTNKQGEPMDKEHAEIMLKIWDELQAKEPVTSMETIRMTEKEKAEFFYFNLVARYGGNELTLLAGNKKESLEDKAEKYFFASETLLFDTHPETEKPYRYGKGWIRKELPEDFEENLDTLLDTIEEQEEERAGEPLFTRFSNDADVLALIEDKTDFEGRDAELCAALCKMFDLTENDLSDIEIDGNRVNVQGDDYLAGDDDEMTEELTENIKESAWAFNSSFLASFCDIDEDVFKVLSEKCEGGNDAILSLIEKCGSLEDFVSEAESADGRGHF